MSIIEGSASTRRPLPPDAQTPASFGFYYCVYLLIGLFPTGFVLAFFCVMVPRFKDIFKDFKTTLPAFTAWTIGLSELMRSGLWIVVVLGALLVPLLPAVITVRQPYRFHRVTYVLIAVILVLMFNMVAGYVGALSMFLPLVKLIRSVSGGEGGGE